MHQPTPLVVRAPLWLATASSLDLSLMTVAPVVLNRVPRALAGAPTLGPWPDADQLVTLRTVPQRHD